MSIKVKRILLYFSLFILIFAVFSPVLLTYLVNLKPVKAKVAEFIFQKTQKQININDFTAQIFPQPGINFYQITFTPALLKGSVQVDRVGIKFNAIHLMQGELVFDQIILDRRTL